MDRYEKFDNKRILIWGYGREGRSSARFCEQWCSPASIEVFEGKREDINEDRYDYIIKSPGIVMEDDNEKYTSQTQIFLECYKNNTIGITGTKGKSTTSALMHRVLTRAGMDAVLVGNIGEPALDHFGHITKDTVAVYEMSCHQLAHLSVSPHVAVFLNLFEEHLDYYKTLDKYFAAKANIAKYQDESDHLFAGGNVPHLPGRAKTCRIDFNEVPEYDLKLLGHHNTYNAHFVYKIASTVYGIDDKTIRDALRDFTGLEHRLCNIGCSCGIDCYDDSISTIPSATIEALSSVKNAKTVLIGGMDRGISYDALISYINDHDMYNYIFMYESGKRIYDGIGRTDNCYLTSDLEAAVKKGFEITPAGSALILSPAAASYGYFKNFEERGDVFRKLCGL